MKLDIKSLWREPLVHFLLIGAAMFLFYDLTREQGSEAPKRIVVNSGQVEQLVANFKRTWMRPATEDELAALVENYVREEVFYREALFTTIRFGASLPCSLVRSLNRNRAAPINRKCTSGSRHRLLMLILILLAPIISHHGVYQIGEV